MRRKTRFPCTVMRGGTSKGVFLQERHLPRDPALRERVILAVFGSPDSRQIDGLGGADSLTSKLAIVAASRGPDRDIDYTFGAVGIDRAFVDYSSNCGNISAAVGPYAVDAGLVKAVEPFTVVRIRNTNTGKMIRAKVPVAGGKFAPDGDYAIAGCPGTGARIELTFLDPGGAATGRLLPTGSVVDEVALAAGRRYRVTVVDAGNPTAFIGAAELGLRGDELPADFDRDQAALATLEAIRRKVGELMAIPVSQSVPKIAFVAPARAYRAATGETIAGESVSLLARVLAMGRMHKAFAITAAIPAAIAAVLPGSVVAGALAEGAPRPADGAIVIGHPAGTMDLKVEAQFRADGPFIAGCTVARTARRIMDGHVIIPGRVYESD